MSDTEQYDASNDTLNDTMNDSVEDAELEAIKVGLMLCHCSRQIWITVPEWNFVMRENCSSLSNDYFKSVRFVRVHFTLGMKIIDFAGPCERDGRRGRKVERAASGNGENHGNAVYFTNRCR